MAAAAWCGLHSASRFVRTPLEELTGPKSSGWPGAPKVPGLETEGLWNQRSDLPILLPYFLASPPHPHGPHACLFISFQGGGLPACLGSSPPFPRVQMTGFLATLGKDPILTGLLWGLGLLWLLREGLALGTLKCGSAAGAVPPLPSKPAHGFKLSPMGQLSAAARAPSSPFPWCLVSTFSIKLISHISQLKVLAFVLPHVDFQASFHPHWRQQSRCSQPNRQRGLSLRHPAPGTTLLHLEGCRGMGQQPQNPDAQKELERK